MAGQTRLAALFQDHAVLQRDRPCPIWGHDEPGRSVQLLLVHAEDGKVVAEGSARADERGLFRGELPAHEAGGRFHLCARGSAEHSIEDVWFGDVWLASGQSNMEWKVAASRDARKEIESAAWPSIRAFKVGPCASREPVDETLGAWAVCSPHTVAEFSAVGYFFAREVHRALGVPIGIIDASWGGTCIEAWLSLPALAPVLPDLEAQLARLRAEQAELPRISAEYAAQVLAWQRAHLPSDLDNRGLALGWAERDQDDGAWPELSLPSFWQSHGMAFNGVVWFRRELELPPEFAGHELTVSLGAVDDFDDSYFDGAPLGRTPPGTPDAHRVQRTYVLPKERVQSGRHCIAVRVFDHVGSGGFAGPAAAMYVESSAAPGRRISLAGRWRYRVEREIPLVPMSVFASFPAPPPSLALHNAPAALFNGMVAPLIPYGLRGMLWYQGESNTARHALYGAQLVALMRDYRTRWGQGQLPFYYVQLANHSASPDWPLLREAQARGECEPEAAMVVTLDIGESRDIHPQNKQEVGRRLSLLARALTHGEAALPCRGPRLARVHHEGAHAIVEWFDASGLRSRDGGPIRGFTLAGGDGRHHPATAHIEGERVRLSASAVARPHAVRYAWADDPDANLENGAGLPAAPFRTDAGS